MSTNLDKLLGVAGAALGAHSRRGIEGLAADDNRLIGELRRLLQRKNGFYAMESALHVFPSEAHNDVVGLDVWNSERGWRSAYGDLAAGCLFFAEDIFGGQFCILDDEICSFDPETGEKTVVANSLEGWAEAIIQDYEVLTGYPLAHAWQEENGALQPGVRLVPKVPFVAGGDYELDNLYAMSSEKAMRLRGELAQQIRDLPDGAEIRFSIVD